MANIVPHSMASQRWFSTAVGTCWKRNISRSSSAAPCLPGPRGAGGAGVRAGGAAGEETRGRRELMRPGCAPPAALPKSSATAPAVSPRGERCHARHPPRLRASETSSIAAFRSAMEASSGELPKPAHRGKQALGSDPPRSSSRTSMPPMVRPPPPLPARTLRALYPGRRLCAPPRPSFRISGSLRARHRPRLLHQFLDHPPSRARSSPSHARSSPSHAHDSIRHGRSSIRHGRSSSSHARASIRHAPSTPSHAPSSPSHARASIRHAPSTPSHAPSSPSHGRDSIRHACSSPSHALDSIRHAPSSPSHAPSSPSHAPSSPSHARASPSHGPSSPDHRHDARSPRRARHLAHVGGCPPDIFCYVGGYPPNKIRHVGACPPSISVYGHRGSRILVLPPRQTQPAETPRQPSHPPRSVEAAGGWHDRCNKGLRTRQSGRGRQQRNERRTRWPPCIEPEES